MAVLPPRNAPALAQFGLMGRICLLVAAVAIASSCARDDESANSRIATGQRLYPGSSVIFPFERGEGIRLNAERGSIAWAPDGRAIVYTAPLEPGEYAYAIVDSTSDDELLANSINVFMEPAAALRDVDVGENSLSARYGDVAVAATLEGGAVVAVWSADTTDTELVVTLDSDNQASLTYGGQTFDGYGALSTEDAIALDQLATGPLGRAITMVPLDLGCADGVAQTDDRLFAPVVLPWQMVLKYSIVERAPVIRAFFAESVCGFPGFFETTTEKPFNSKVLWDVDHSVPAVHLVFPLDGHGQLRVEGR